MATNLWEQTQQKFAQQAAPAVSTSAVNTPSSTGANTTNVNTALRGKGVRPEQIGYNPSTNDYSVDGKQFLRANKNYGGAGYTSPNSFMQAWKSYNQAQKAQPATQPTTTGYNPYASSASNMNPYNQQVNSMISSIMNMAQNPQAIDPYSTAEYAAAQAQANRAAGQNIRAAQEAYGSAGFGRSYGLGERAQGIQNDATNYLMTQVVPSIIAAKQAEQQNQFNNAISALNQLIGQQGRADQQVQQDWLNNYNVGQLTGNYMPAGAQQVINDLMGLKRQAETQGITADQRAGLSSQADVLRSQLANMGIDPTLFGANVSAANAGQNMGNVGMRTLAGQQQDLANREFNVNTALQFGDRAGQILSPQQDPTGYLRQLESGMTSAGTPIQQSLEGQQVESGLVTDQQQRDLATRSVALQEWQTTGYATPAVSSILGVPQGTPTNDASYRQAAQSLDNDKFTYQQMQDKAAAQNQPTQAKSINTTTAAQLLLKQNGVDDKGNPVFAPYTDPAHKEDAFINLYQNYGVTGNDMVEALSKAGYSSEEINKLRNGYPEVFR